MKWFEEMRLNVALPFATLVIVIGFTCELKIHETAVLYELNVVIEDVPQRPAFLSSCTNGCTISVFSKFSDSESTKWVQNFNYLTLMGDNSA